MRALFKDLDRINNKSKQEENLNEIYRSMNNEKELKKLLMRGNEPEEKEHNENHSRCSYKREDKIIAHTEKRMCRCMFYHNNRDTEKNCSTCSYDQKWVNLSKKEYEITDYEVPPKFVCKGIGGVDLVIKYQKEKYSVEMKPEDSKETIVRMIAEALTYNLDEKFEKKNIPSIGYFKGSKQEEQFWDLYNSSKLKEILEGKNIAVFEFSIQSENAETKERFFKIKKII